MRVFTALIHRLRDLGGQSFYCVDEKPLGTPKQTQLDHEARGAAAMTETLHRLARHAESKSNYLLALIDQVKEKQRRARVPSMYAHMFHRASKFEEMKRMVEPPMHLDSAVSANIQFAKWSAA